MLADEVDRYPVSAGTEGDPLSLALKRMGAFWNACTVIASTPTIKGLSRIEMEFNRSDKRYYFVPCVHCGHYQRLAWARVRWPEGDPSKAGYHCAGEGCGVEWTEADRLVAVRKGEWRATDPAGGFPGFHVSELYSPWSSIPRIAESFVAAQISAETRRVWVNTVLGEPYETDVEVVDHHILGHPSRLEEWPTDAVPRDVELVTAGVDIQADRIEAERVGWGIDEESWSLDHLVLRGDPSDPALWRQLDAYLLEPTIRVDGTILPVNTTCVDSGGHHTQQVYRWTRQRRNRRVFAIKGRAEQTTVWPPMRKNKTKSEVVTIGVSAAKDAIYSRLKITTPGPGFCHFPKDRSPVWFEQLTSEVVQTKYLKGFPKREYVLPAGRRNEALDCRAYAYAALQSLNVRWGVRVAANAISERAKPKPLIAPASVLAKPAAASPRRAEFWRGNNTGRDRPGFLGMRRGWLRGDR